MASGTNDGSRRDWRSELHGAAGQYHEHEQIAHEEEVSFAIERACESPIERMLIARLAFIRVYGRAPIVFGLIRPSTPLLYDAPPDLSLLTLQYPIEDYRVDAALWFRDYGGALVGIVVEADGHEYHERTKRQAARDRSRDRALTTAGYHVMRFTGSEIYSATRQCAQQVEGLAERIIKDSARRDF